MQAATSSLTVKVCETKEQFNALRADWDHLTERSGADIFQTHQWQYSWWESFGGGNSLYIITYWSGELLVGILPFFFEHRDISQLKFTKTLQFIGSRISTPNGGALPVDLSFGGYLDIIADPYHIPAIVREVRSVLEDMINITDQIFLDELPQNSLLIHAIDDIQDNSNCSITVSDASQCSECLIAGNWEAYLKQLSSSTRKNIRRGLRDLEDHNVFNVHRAKTEAEFTRIFDILVRLHQNRWNQLNKPGIFADKRIEDFFRNTALTLFKNDMAKLVWAEKDDEIFAAELFYTFNNTIYAVQGGFDAHSKYSKYSPSNLLIYQTMKYGAESGYMTFDWGRGTETYKSSTSNLVIQNKAIRLSCRSRSKAVKLTVTNTLTEARTKFKNELLTLSVYYDNYSFASATGKFIYHLRQKAFK